MRRSMVAAFLVVCFLSCGLFAQTTTTSESDLNALRAQIDAVKADYDKRISDLETQLAALQARLIERPQPVNTVGLRSAVFTNPVNSSVSPMLLPPAPRPPAIQVPGGADSLAPQTNSQAVSGSSVSNAKAFNPDIAVIGDFLAASGSNKVNPQPAMEMHESELAFQAIVDPYARADFFFSFGEEGVGLEEGYITFPAIKGGLLVKVGKMRAAFGRINQMHNHVLPWTDRPLVNENLVGGEDGIDDAGFSVARLIPIPKIFLEATAQVFRGDSDNLYFSNDRSHLSYVGHLRGYQDITNNTNLDIGASFSQGHNPSGFDTPDFGLLKTTLYGADATLRWKPLQRAIYHSFVARSEVVWSRRDQPGGLQRSLGYYVSGDYQLGRRWFAGGRYDWTNLADDASLHDSGQSAVLTYWPSEFSQIRGQYRRTRYAVGPTANEFLAQFQFSIGAHGAHPF